MLVIFFHLQIDVHFRKLILLNVHRPLFINPTFHQSDFSSIRLDQSANAHQFILHYLGIVAKVLLSWAHQSNELNKHYIVCTPSKNYKGKIIIRAFLYSQFLPCFSSHKYYISKSQILYTAAILSRWTFQNRFQFIAF